MKNIPAHRRPLCTALVVLACATAPASAAFVYENSSRATVNSTLSVIGNARYHLDQLNYDQNIQAGGGTVTASNIVTGDVGNVSVLTNRAVNFMLENRAGQGLIFTLSAPASGGLAAFSSTLSWGTFTPAVAGSVSTIGGMSFGGAFNTISITGQATRVSTSLEFTNLAFTAPDLTLADGSLYNGISSTSAAGTATGSLYSPAPQTASPFNSLTQLILADTDLSRVNWTFSGTITGVRDATSAGAAAVAFQVTLSNSDAIFPVTGEATIVPEPTVAALLPMSAALLLRRHRRALA